MPPELTADSELSTSISTALFSKRVVMRAAHRLTGECSFEFHEEEGKIIAVIHPKNLESTKDWKGTFLNEILDEELREQIANETHAERALIIAHALSRHPVINKELAQSPAFPAKDN